MAINEKARTTFAALFPETTSTLALTDPELVEVFTHFAFDETLRESSLDPRTRLMVQLGALIACAALGEYTVTLHAAIAVGVTPVAIKEVVYQAVPYVGMGRVVDFLHATNTFLLEKGVSLPLERQATTTPDTRYEKGLALQKSIVGDAPIDAMYASAPIDQQHIQRFLSANCFGDYVSRGALDVPARELLTFSLLAGLGGCEPQLRGHVMANLHVGNTRGMLIDVVTQILPFIGYPRALNAMRIVSENTTTE